MNEKIVGHKTIRLEGGGFRHEPLTESEANRIFEAAEAATAKRAADMPTERDAIVALWNAWQRLKELGWKEAMYCPKNGSRFQVIEAGSTGVFECTYDGEWPTGHYWIQGVDDIYPSRPILFKPVEPTA